MPAQGPPRGGSSWRPSGHEEALLAAHHEAVHLAAITRRPSEAAAHHEAALQKVQASHQVRDRVVSRRSPKRTESQSTVRWPRWSSKVLNVATKMSKYNWQITSCPDSVLSDSVANGRHKLLRFRAVRTQLMSKLSAHSFPRLRKQFLDCMFGQTWLGNQPSSHHHFRNPSTMGGKFV